MKPLDCCFVGRTRLLGRPGILDWHQQTEEATRKSRRGRNEQVWSSRVALRVFLEAHGTFGVGSGNRNR